MSVYAFLCGKILLYFAYNNVFLHGGKVTENPETFSGIVSPSLVPAQHEFA